MIFLLLTIILSICSGVWVFKRIFNQIMVVYYHNKYKTEESYVDIYNYLDEEFNFEILKDLPYSAQDYAEFLLRHQSAREYAYEYLNDVMQVYKEQIIKYTIGLLIISILFFQFFLVFLLINFIIIVGYAIYEKYVLNHGELFYLQIMLMMILKLYNASDHLVFKNLADSLDIPAALREDKLFNEILRIELGFWRMPHGSGYVSKHFSSKGLFIMPSPNGEWAYLNKKEYMKSVLEDGLSEIFHKIKGIRFTKLSEDLVVLSYGITAIYETGRDYRVLACSTYKKNKNNNWQQIIHQQGKAKF